MSTTSQHFIALGDITLPIQIRRHPSSRRIVLRYHARQNHIGMTLPRYTSIKQGLDFAHAQRNWILKQLSNHPSRIAFCDGQSIPIFGQACTLTHVGGRGVITREENRVLVPGDAAFMARRVEQWLKAHMRETVVPLVQEKAKLLEVRVAKISLRDNASCWGSCNHSGNLSFSWRLVLAEPEILNYIVCHEVAHLRELNHSDRFWRLVASICPHWEASRDWLKKHGHTLHAYG